MKTVKEVNKFIIGTTIGGLAGLLFIYTLPGSLLVGSFLWVALLAYLLWKSYQ